MSQKLPIRLRSANEDDVSFIFNAWLKSFRNSDFCRNIPNEIYYAEHHKVIEKILKHYNVTIVCNESDPAQIYGFMCAGHTDGIFTIHYTYVKQPFRGMGIAKEMLKSFNHDIKYASIYTHMSKSARFLAQRYNFIYHPYVGIVPEDYNKSKKES